MRQSAKFPQNGEYRTTGRWRQLAICRGRAKSNADGCLLASPQAELLVFDPAKLLARTAGI
jgi:hypothetical protein